MRLKATVRWRRRRRRRLGRAYSFFTAFAKYLSTPSLHVVCCVVSDQIKLDRSVLSHVRIIQYNATVRIVVIIFAIDGLSETKHFGIENSDPKKSYVFIFDFIFSINIWRLMMICTVFYRGTKTHGLMASNDFYLIIYYFWRLFSRFVFIWNLILYWVILFSQSNTRTLYNTIRKNSKETMFT